MTRYIGRPARIEPLWVRVERNRIKLAVFMVCFVLAWSVAAMLVLFLPTLALFFAIGLLAGDALGGSDASLLWHIADWGLGSVWNLVLFSAAVGAVTAIVYAWYALTQPLWRQMTAISAFRPARGQYPTTKSALRDMAIASGFADCLPMLYVIESSSINAFVVARGWHRAYCVVTTGMANAFDADEQRAVFANLMARLRAGDVQWATVVSTLMAPVWKWRQYDLERDIEKGAPEGRLYEVGDRVNGPEYVGAGLGGATLFPLGWAAYMAAVVASEFVAFGHRRSQLLSAEVADAEGMLLLKDPVSMLRTLRKAIIADNRVRVAAPLYAQLFYIWAGDDLADDEDPEWRRLERLREVLGVEGIADAETELFEVAVGAPGAPRLEGVRAAAAEPRTIVLPQWVLLVPLILSALTILVAAGYLFDVANMERPVMLTQPTGPEWEVYVHKVMWAENVLIATVAAGAFLSSVVVGKRRLGAIVGVAFAAGAVLVAGLANSLTPADPGRPLGISIALMLFVGASGGLSGGAIGWLVGGRARNRQSSREAQEKVS